MLEKLLLPKSQSIRPIVKKDMLLGRKVDRLLYLNLDKHD